MKNKSRTNYEKYKHKIIEELKGGYQLKELSKKYDIVYSSLSLFIKRDKSINFNPKVRIQTNYFEIFDRKKQEIIEHLENGNSILNTTEIFKINRKSLNIKLKELGLFEKYSNRFHTKSFVNFKKNKDEIIKMRREGYGVPDLVEKFNVKRHTLQIELKKLGEYDIDVSKRQMFQTDGVKKFNDIKNKLIIEFKNGKSLRSLSRQYDVPFSTIQTKFIQEGIYEQQKRFIHQFNENYFNKIDEPKKSYWLGWMYSDGIVQINKNTKQKSVTLELSKKDTNVMEDFRKDLKSNISLRLIKHKGYTNSKGNKVHKTENYRFSFSSEKMFDDLGKLGVVPRKSLILKFPTKKQVPINFIKSFLLGYFEGDGSIIKILRKRLDTYRLHMNIVGTKELCNGYKDQLKLIFNEYGVEGKIHIRKEGRSDNNTYLLGVGSVSTVLVWFDSIYSNHNSVMNRKKIKIVDYCKWYKKTYLEKNETPLHMKNIDVIKKIVLKYCKD